MPDSLPHAVKSADWHREVMCYLFILRGLHLATHSRWKDAQKCILELEKIIKPPLEGLLGLSRKYLSGAIAQGTGDLDTALSLYSDSCFDVESFGRRQGGRKQAEYELSLLAALNRLCIMQHNAYQDDQETLDLLDLLRPLCGDHPNLEIRITFNLVLAAINTNPPIPMTAVKTHISTALNGAKALGDVKTSAIALSLMQVKLFQGIVGDQAMKSARAASQQAKRSGSNLWMSVADGMLASSLEVQGLTAEAWSVRQDAERNAALAFGA